MHWQNLVLFKRAQAPTETEELCRPLLFCSPAALQQVPFEGRSFSYSWREGWGQLYDTAAGGPKRGPGRSGRWEKRWAQTPVSGDQGRASHPSNSGHLPCGEGTVIPRNSCLKSKQPARNKELRGQNFVTGEIRGTIISPVKRSPFPKDRDAFLCASLIQPGHKPSPRGAPPTGLRPQHSDSHRTL